jgi:hypothetical protein
MDLSGLWCCEELWNPRSPKWAPGFLRSHPSHKNKNVARVGHPDCAGKDWRLLAFAGDPFFEFGFLEGA